MADGVVLNAGAGGVTAATDDCGAAGHAQVIKLAIATDGSATHIPADATNGLLVDVSRVTGNVAVTHAALTELAGAIDTEMQVDVVTSALPSGAATSAKQDTMIGHLDGVEGSLTSITTAVQLLDDAVQVLGTDTYTETTSKGITISAVRRDADTTLVNTTNEFGPLQMDANGRLKVEVFSGEALPVTLTSTTITGTVAVTQSGTWDEIGINDSGNSITVDSPTLTTLAGAVSGTEMQVDVLTMPTVAVTQSGAWDEVGIHDSGNSITVDATNLDIRDLSAAADSVTIHGDVGAIDQLDLTNTNPIAVAIVDGDGTQITSFGGGTQYTEDNAAAANPVGTAVILVRADTPAGVTTTDGDNVAQRGTDYGAAYVTLLDAAGAPVAFGSGGTSAADDADFTAGTTLGTPAMGVYDSTPDTITDGDLGTIGITSTRAVRTVVEGTVAVTQSGTWDEVGIHDSGNSITVDSATLTTIAGAVSGTEMQVDVITLPAIPAGNNNIGDVDIASIAAGDNNIGNVDIVSLPAIPAGTNNIGDVDILTIAAGDNNIGNVDIVTMPNVTLAAGTNTNEVVGDVAHDAGIAGNPITVGGVSQDMDDTAPPNRVNAEADAVRLATCRDGGVFVHPHGPQVWSKHLDGSTAYTDESIHAAPGANLSLYVTDIVFSSGAATAINIFFEEGASKVLGPYYLEAVAGRGLALHFQTPKKITANTALTVTTSASIAQSIDVTGFTAQG